MTAITGFICQDGLVIAGDTQESYGSGEDKTYCHKLFPVERPKARLCVAGAGVGYLIDFANEQIVSALDSGIKTVLEFQARLSDVMNRLYANEFKNYPLDSEAHRNIQLLVGVQFGSDANPSVWTHPTLFQCQSNLVTPLGRGKYGCIFGTGELLKHLATEFAGWGLTVDLAEWVSIYLISEAKRRYGGVGGNTHTFLMRTDGTFSYGLGKNVDEKEMLLIALGRIDQLFMLSLDPSVPEDRAKDFVDAGVRWLRDVRQTLQKLKHEGSKIKPMLEIRSREIDKLMRRISKQSASQKSESEQ